MVGRDEHLAAHLKDRINDLSDAFVHCFYCFHCRFEHARMSHHIAVRKIEDHNVVFLQFDQLHRLCAYLRRAHFRLEVIRCDLRRRDEHSVLSLVRLFYAAVEEEGHMRILLCFRDAELLFALFRKIFPQRIPEHLRLIGHMHVLERLIVLCHTYEKGGEIGVRKAVEIRLCDAARQFARTVRAEIKKDDRIVCLKLCDRFAVFRDDYGLYELVVLLFVVGGLHCLGCVRRVHALSFYDRVIGKLHTLPAVIPVHCIVTAHDRRDPAHTDLFDFCLELFNETLSAVRRYVAAIHQAMYVCPVPDAVFFRQLQERI